VLSTSNSGEIAIDGFGVGKFPGFVGGDLAAVDARVVQLAVEGECAALVAAEVKAVAVLESECACGWGLGAQDAVDVEAFGGTVVRAGDVVPLCGGNGAVADLVATDGDADVAGGG